MKRCICAVVFPVLSTDLQYKVKYAPWCQSSDRDGWSHCGWELTSGEPSKAHNGKESWELQNAGRFHFYLPALWSVIWKQHTAGCVQWDSHTVQLQYCILTAYCMIFVCVYCVICCAQTLDCETGSEMMIHGNITWRHDLILPDHKNIVKLNI